jgi:hypothetical protein
MGWFDAKYDGKKVLLGDEALDLTHELLQKLAEVYEDGAGRKPTAEELAALLELVLGTSADEYLEDFQTRRVSGVTIKSDKKKKDQDYQAGDVFAVPFGDRFAFGRIMSRANPNGALIEFFKETSPRKHVTPSILASGRAIHPVIVAESLALEPWRWTVVLSDPKYKMSKEDEKLEFGVGDMDEFWTETYTGKRVRDITKDQWKKMTDNGAQHHEGVEEQVQKALKLPPPGAKKAPGKAKKDAKKSR